MAELTQGRETDLPTWAMGLTPRQLSFVQEYLVDFNGRKAAERAQLSSSKGGQGSIAKSLLRDPEVMAAIGAAMADSVATRLKLRQRIIEELSAVAFYDVVDHVQVVDGRPEAERDLDPEGRVSAPVRNVVLATTDQLTEDQRRAVKRYKQTTGEKSQSIEVEFHDKVKALDLLAKINGDIQQGGGLNLTLNNQTTTNEKVLVLTPDEMAAAGKGPKAARPLTITSPINED
jgi:hypothetical protein